MLFKTVYQTVKISKVAPTQAESLALLLGMLRTGWRIQHIIPLASGHTVVFLSLRIWWGPLRKFAAFFALAPRSSRAYAVRRS